MEAVATTVMGFDAMVQANGVEYAEERAWGQLVGLMSITAGEVIEWVQSKEDSDVERRKQAGLLLLARSFVGPDRRRLCDTPEKEQQMVEALKLKDSKSVNQLVTRVLKLNGIVDETAATAKNDSAVSL